MSQSLLIIVPTLNSFHLLPRLIDSLKAQSWPHWRLIFVDGPSVPDHRDWLHRCCCSDPRFSWVEQDPSLPGIFGAMNQGFALADPNDWVLFWGSDDWAASSCALSKAMSFLEYQSGSLDLLVCSGRYVNSSSGELSRVSLFKPQCFLNAYSFRKALFFGLTPPHKLLCLALVHVLFSQNISWDFDLQQILIISYALVENLICLSTVSMFNLYICQMVV